VLEVVYWFTQVLGYSHFVIDRRRQRLAYYPVFFFHDNPTQPYTSKNQHFCTYMNT
jgi:hypothetical protein